MFEMSRYINLDLYHAVERSHPFYVEMIEEIRAQIAQRFTGNEPVRVLEFGAGTGLATEELVKHSNLRIDALDFDSECCNLLRQHMGSAVNVIQGDAVTYSREGEYDLVVSVFAHDHIVYEKGPTLAANIRRNLRKGGIYIMGGEILPVFSNDDDRVGALHDYHGYIIDKALRGRHFQLAQIEIDALQSGIDKIGDFKRHENMFEAEMISADFILRQKKKMGPLERDNVGGVYVYAYEAL